MNWLGLVLPIAKDDGFNVVQLVFMIIVGIFWAVGALLSKAQKEKARLKAEQLRQAKAAHPGQADDDEGWLSVAPPVLSAAEDEPPATPKPPITQFVKPREVRKKDPRAKLAQLEPVHHLRHAQAKSLPVLHEEDELPRRKGKKVRQAKAVSPKPVKRDKLQTKPHAKQIPAVEASTQQKMSPILARLGEQKPARTAMIFHEIFSPPKALREESNLWE